MKDMKGEITLLQNKYLTCLLTIVSLLVVTSHSAFAMHIMEGFLPPKFAAFWGIICLPFLILGFVRIQKIVKDNPKLKLLLGLCGAFAFVLSALKIPSVTGSCSHPTGVGLGAILFGPTVTTVLGFIVLLFQALLLAHGGLTTLGANVFSMAIVGPFVSFGIYHLLQKMNCSRNVAVFCAATLGDLFTYVTTAIELAWAFPSPIGGIMVSLVKFLGIFAVTQIPLAVAEGFLTVVMFNFLTAYSGEELKLLANLTKRGGKANAN